jgi:hypothetical protein
MAMMNTIKAVIFIANEDEFETVLSHPVGTAQAIEIPSEEGQIYERPSQKPSRGVKG